MFKSIIMLLLYCVLFPVVLFALASLWFYLFPEYWWGLMVITIIALIWFFPKLTKKFEIYK